MGSVTQRKDFETLLGDCILQIWVCCCSAGIHRLSWDALQGSVDIFLLWTQRGSDKCWSQSELIRGESIEPVSTQTVLSATHACVTVTHLPPLLRQAPRLWDRRVVFPGRSSSSPFTHLYRYFNQRFLPPGWVILFAVSMAKQVI